MNREEARAAAEVMLAYADGKEVEVSAMGNFWDSATFPTFDFVRFHYRVKRTPPSINWDHVAKDWNYMATDDNCDTWLYHSTPTCRGGYWHAPGSYVNAEHFTSFVKGTTLPTDSLVVRPGYTGEA